MKQKILTREIVKENSWDKLKTITANMLDGYTVIGKRAFANCFYLTSVEIPNSVISIEFSAFENCYSLTSITISNNITRIGCSAFSCCINLASVTIPNNIAYIEDCAFYGCTNLTSIIIPNSVTIIGDCAFYGCRGLIIVAIPNSVISIGNEAFYDCGLKVEKRYDTQGRLIAYKGFEHNMTCRDFQYEEGKTYKIDGKIELCQRGFHACTNPMDCMNYYWGKIGKNVVYHEVYLEDVSDEPGVDSKVVARKITIGREIMFAEMADIASDRKQ